MSTKPRICVICRKPVDDANKAVVFTAGGLPAFVVHEGECALFVRKGARMMKDVASNLVERRYPGVAGRLHSAFEFLKELRDGGRGESA